MIQAIAIRLGAFLLWTLGGLRSGLFTVRGLMVAALALMIAAGVLSSDQMSRIPAYAGAVDKAQKAAAPKGSFRITPVEKDGSAQEEVFAALGVEEDEMAGPAVSVSFGRSDPFAPLIYLGDPSGRVRDVEDDPLADLQFVGRIGGGYNGDEAVAILQINDPYRGSRSLVRQAGETFSLGDKVVRIESVMPEQLTVTINGEERAVELSPFVDRVATTAENGDSRQGEDFDTVEELEGEPQ